MSGETAAIKGLIIPAEWDEKGKVVKVVIAAFDETEYIVGETTKSSDLIAFINKEVEVVGQVWGHEVGTPVIQVEEYRVLDGTTKFHGSG